MVLFSCQNLILNSILNGTLLSIVDNYQRRNIQSITGGKSRVLLSESFSLPVRQPLKHLSLLMSPQNSLNTRDPGQNSHFADKESEDQKGQTRNLQRLKEVESLWFYCQEFLLFNNLLMQCLLRTLLNMLLYLLVH